MGTNFSDNELFTNEYENNSMNQINPYKIYLKGELAKLSNSGDAKDFLDAFGNSRCENYGIQSNLDQLKQQFSSQSKVNNFVDSTDESNLNILTEIIDTNWRKNGVYRKLSIYKNWNIGDIFLDSILINQAEPKWKCFWEKHNYRLKDIARDKDLLNLSPYNKYPSYTKVEYDTLLAIKNLHEYQIFDGIHRAIQLVRNESIQLKLCWGNTIL